MPAGCRIAMLTCRKPISVEWKNAMDVEMVSRNVPTSQQHDQSQSPIIAKFSQTPASEQAISQRSKAPNMFNSVKRQKAHHVGAKRVSKPLMPPKTSSRQKMVKKAPISVEYVEDSSDNESFGESVGSADSPHSGASEEYSYETDATYQTGDELDNVNSGNEQATNHEDDMEEYSFADSQKHALKKHPSIGGKYPRKRYTPDTQPSTVEPKKQRKR